MSRQPGKRGEADERQDAQGQRLPAARFVSVGMGAPYRELGALYYEQQRKPETTKYLVGRLERLGFQVTREVPLSEEEAELAVLAEDGNNVAPVKRSREPGAVAVEPNRRFTML